MAALDTVAPAFVEMAHRIVWCVAATTDPRGRPRSRVLHPMWEWNGAQLTGWVLTSPGGRFTAHSDVRHGLRFFDTRTGRPTPWVRPARPKCCIGGAFTADASQRSIARSPSR